ncbi:hypothetical protein FisN_1Hh200 [Fistulifera solaris]|uniref:NADH dehydrogenase [ubiquinone] iron-sulfur protein 5 n=1 Tax=Fistulifera solaris TaxID=1519565 RepID=A0A1Z5JE65_FISSO|nr:hypothetical protein FisN_1Hh200 [Fistulifera solaris]|eukprot:GAX12269.1 hypothetical protein FisN_1Hh200 [Fistulifera solaris]
MASGMGVRGTTGRCYGFYHDLLECQHEYQKTLLTEGKDSKPCSDRRQDYFECLHSRKELTRVKAVLLEEAKQAYEAKHGKHAH